MIRKRVKRMTAILACICMIAQPLSVGGKPTKVMAATPPSEEEFIENDYIVYYVNCGATITDRVADGDKMGLYQSVTDQAYGEDAVTGYKWGYREDDENSVKVSSGDATSLNKTEIGRAHV